MYEQGVGVALGEGIAAAIPSVLFADERDAIE
jgi:hypothetical protein